MSSSQDFLPLLKRIYPIYYKELLVIIDALEQWKHLLKGIFIPFTIFFDHRNLLYQKKLVKMSQRLVRWARLLSEFNFKITYIMLVPLMVNPMYFLVKQTILFSEEELSFDIPFSVFRTENFCATTTLITSLTDQILNKS